MLSSHPVVILLISILSIVNGATVPYSLTIAPVTTYPDGVKKVNTLTFNGVFPGPLITANLGDQLVITVTNLLSEPTSIHWHGLFQNGTQFQDGPNMVTQCPIQPGQTQVYNFTAAQSGSYWYHGHYHSQYTDGLVGPLVIYDPAESNTYGYDDEIVVVLGDWYHTSYQTNENFYLSTGVPPFPNSPLINGRGQFPCVVLLNLLGQILNTAQCYPPKQSRSLYRMMPGATYRVRVINTSAMSAFTFSIDGHKLRAIEVDGVSLANPSGIVDFASIGTAQRYSFLLDMDQSIDKYLIRAVMKTDFLVQFNKTQNLNVNAEKTLRPVATAVLFYDPTMLTPSPIVTFEPYTFLNSAPSDNRNTFVVLDDQELQLLPKDGLTAPSFPTDVQVSLNVSISMITRPGSSIPVPQSVFNGNAFVLPVAGVDDPLLTQVVKGQTLAPTTNPIVVGRMKTVQIVINNEEPLQHPIHLHGHAFWVVGKGAPFAGAYNAARDGPTLAQATIKRDTILVNANSWVVLRFVGDNVGVWSLHCHIDWHNAGGMAVTFVEGPEVLTGLPIPAETLRVCAQQT